MREVPPAQPLATAIPNELALEVNIASSRFMSESWAQGLVATNLASDGSVIQGVAYNSLSGLADQKLVKLYGAYVLTASENRYPGFITLLFSKNKTSTVVNDPNNPLTPVRTNVETVDGIYWNPILIRIKFLASDYGFTQNGFDKFGNQGVNTAARYVVRQIYIPGTSKGTRKITRTFQNATPFQIPQWDAPLPTEVSFHYINLSGGFPLCLHKRLVLEDLIGATGFAGPGSTSTPSYETLEGQIFPATNFTGWESYFPDDGQKLINGVWTRTQTEYVPPEEPDVISETSPA